MDATGTMGTAGNESVIMVEANNVFKLSKGGANGAATDGSINNDLSPKN